MLNQNINSAKCDNATRMDQQDKIMLPKEALFTPIWASNDQVGRRKERLKDTNWSILKIMLS